MEEVPHRTLLAPLASPCFLLYFKRVETEGLFSGRKKAHKHKLFALVNVQMALGQTAGCPRVNRAKKFMCSPGNTGNINFLLWLTGGLSQGCPDFQKVFVFKVYVPFSCPILDYQGRGGYHFHCTVEPLPGHIRCRGDFSEKLKGNN